MYASDKPSPHIRAVVIFRFFLLIKDNKKFTPSLTTNRMANIKTKIINFFTINILRLLLKYTLKLEIVKSKT